MDPIQRTGSDATIQPHMNSPLGIFCSMQYAEWTRCGVLTCRPLVLVSK